MEYHSDIRKDEWCNTAICDHMGGSWEYTKQNMSDGKSSEPYDFTHMWDLKLKTANEKQADRNS